MRLEEKGNTSSCRICGDLLTQIASLLSAQSMLARLAFAGVLAVLAGSAWEKPPEDDLPPLYATLAVVAVAALGGLHLLHARWARRAPAGVPTEH